MSTSFTSTKPFVVMMYGFPGSGKTSFARQLSEELGIVHLQEDKIRHELFGAQPSQAANKGSRKIMNYMAKEYIHAGLPVIYDASVLRGSDRKVVREMAHAAKVPSVLVWLQVDPETTFARTQKRDKRKADDKYAYEYDEATYREILAYMQNPGPTEDYIVVSGKHTFVSQRSTFMKKLYDLGIVTPETASNKVIKPELMNHIPKPMVQTRGDIIHRNISIR
mgnify:CR=1 FL=1